MSSEPTPDIPGKFPNGLAAALEKSPISQAELARALNTSRQQVGRWMKGERKLRPDTAVKIAAVLPDVTAEELLLPREHFPLVRGAEAEKVREKIDEERREKDLVLEAIRRLSADARADVLAEAVAIVAGRRK